MEAIQDLQCIPLENGSPPSAVHTDYLSQYTTQVQNLVSEWFLLQKDADRLIAQVIASNVGDPVACTSEPVLLPATGPEKGGISVLIVILLSGILLSGGIVFQKKEI